MIYSNLEEWDKAAERYEVNIQNRVEATHSYVNLAVTYEDRGIYDKAREVLELYLTDIAENARVRRALSDVYLYQGKYDLALAEVNKAISLEPDNFQNLNLKGDIFFYKHDLAKAEELYQKLTLNNEVIARVLGIVGLTALDMLHGRYEEAIKRLKISVQLAEEHGEKVGAWLLRRLLTYIQTQSGNPGEALEELDKMWVVALEEKNPGWQRFVWENKAIAHVIMNSIDESRKAANELKKLLEQAANKKLMRDYHYTAALIELRMKNYSSAIENLDKALALYPYHQGSSLTLFLDILALAYFESGELDKAQENYERITQLTVPRYFFSDIYAKSFYMLGRIFEQKDYKGKAIENYEKFLELWKDADPGIVEVEDAKTRLEALKRIP